MPIARISRLALVAAGLVAVAVAATACVRNPPIALAPTRVLDTVADDRHRPDTNAPTTHDATAVTALTTADDLDRRAILVPVGAILPDTVHLGTVVADRLPAWDDRAVYLADAATRRVTAVVRLPLTTDLTAVAVDATGTQLAALRRSGPALHWPTLTATPRRLTPNILAAPDPIPEPIDARRHADLRRVIGHDYQLLAEPYRPNPWGRHADYPDDDLGILHRAALRLAFSPDGTRLVAGMHLYALADGRDLLPLRADEIALDLTADAAIVARFALDVFTVGSFGGWCGTSRAVVLRHLRLTALEYRAVDAAPIPFPSRASIPRRASVERREVELEHELLRLPAIITTSRPTPSTTTAAPTTGTAD